MKPEELCDQLTARIEAAMTLRQSAYNAVAMRQSAREIAHIILPIVLAYETKARADERAKVAEEIEADMEYWPKSNLFARNGAQRAARIARGERP